MNTVDGRTVLFWGQNPLYSQAVVIDIPETNMGVQKGAFKRKGLTWESKKGPIKITALVEGGLFGFSCQFWGSVDVAESFSFTSTCFGGRISQCRPPRVLA